MDVLMETSPPCLLQQGTLHFLAAPNFCELLLADALVNISDVFLFHKNKVDILNWVKD